MTFNVKFFNRTLAHELGHGAFAYEHQFDNAAYKTGQGTTHNLMDYVKDDDLAYFQWQSTLGLNLTWGFLEGDEDGMMWKTDNLVINIHRNNKNINNSSYLNIKDYLYATKDKNKVTSGTYVMDNINCSYNISYSVVDILVGTFYINTKECLMTKSSINSSYVFRFYNYKKENRQIPLAPVYNKDENNYIEIIVPEDEMGLFCSYVYLPNLKITCASNVPCDYITPEIRKCLYRIWSSSNVNRSVVITSTYRDGKDQIGAMITFIKNKGSAESYSTYGTKGDQIIDTYKKFVIDNIEAASASTSNSSIKGFVLTMVEMLKNKGLPIESQLNTKYKNYLLDVNRRTSALNVYDKVVKNLKFNNNPNESKQIIINKLLAESNIDSNSSIKGLILSMVEMIKEIELVNESGLMNKSDFETQYRAYLDDNNIRSTVVKIYTDLLTNRYSEVKDLMYQKSLSNGFCSAHSNWKDRGAIDFGENSNGYALPKNQLELEDLVKNAKKDSKINPSQVFKPGKSEPAFHIEVKLK